jgi:hypothetical protein
MVGRRKRTVPPPPILAHCPCKVRCWKYINSGKSHSNSVRKGGVPTKTRAGRGAQPHCNNLSGLTALDKLGFQVACMMSTFKTTGIETSLGEGAPLLSEADFGLAETAEGKRRRSWSKGIRNISVNCDRGGLCWVSSKTDCVRGGKSNNSKENGDGAFRTTRQSVRQALHKHGEVA